MENLRIALSMNPAGDALRVRCRNYPGLVNSTTIDWMFPWPEQALVAVANVTLRDVRQPSYTSMVTMSSYAFRLNIFPPR